MVDWARSASLTREQKEARDWRDACALDAHGALEVHVLNDSLLARKPCDVATIYQTFGGLRL